MGFEEALRRVSQTDKSEVDVIASLPEDEEPIHLVEDEDTGDRLLIHSTQDGVQVEFRYLSDTLWMSQSQIADLFGRDVATVSRHIRNIIDEGELDESTSLQKVQRSMGRPLTIYSLDMIISVGYRVSSREATMFRKWATDKLVQFATKGYVVDVERLKDPEKGRGNSKAELKALWVTSMTTDITALFPVSSSLTQTPSSDQIERPI